MVSYAMVCHEIWTRTLPYTEEFHTFKSKIKRSESVLLICNVSIYSSKYKHLKPSWNHVVCYAMVWYDEWDSMRLYAILWDSNAMLWAFNAMLCNLQC